jgi:hypothetical protein
VNEPSDHDIELQLRRAPTDRWTSLWTAVDEFDWEAEHVTWGGGQQVETTVVDGVERPVFQMPYAIYSDAAQSVLRGLSGIGAVVPFSWPDWDGLERYAGGRGLDAAPVADAVRMATAVIRSDRFSEGSIGGALEDGTLLAVLRRLRHWYDHEQGREAT